MPKCVVIGGSGFIGSTLVEVLIADSWEVAVLDTRKPLSEVEWIDQDIRLDLGLALRGFDFVFHLAAVANARRCSEKPELCGNTNMLGTINILEAARRAEVKRVVLASSAWVAGTQIGETISEDSPFDLSRLNTVYGCSKIAQENLCHSYRSEYGGPDYTILRYGTPYGERMWRGLVVRAFMEMATTGGFLPILGDGKQTREFLYVRDLCEAHLGVLSEHTANQTYFVTGDKPISIETIANEVTKHFPARIEYVPQARIEPKFTRIDNSKAKRDLSWLIRTSFEDGIQRCVDWWKRLSDDERRQDYWC